MKKTAKTISTAIIISVVSALPVVRAGVLPKTANLVPPETVLLVNVDNFNQIKTQFKKTNFYKLYKDPAMTAFVENVETKCREKIKELNNEFVGTIIDADTLPQGRVSFALVLNKQAIDANEPLALFITQWGENITKIKDAVNKMVEKAVEDGKHQKSEDYRDVTIKTIIAENSSRLGFGFCSTLSFCFVDDCLIGSEDIELLKFAIAHIKGVGSPTLADDTDYTAAIAATGPHHDIDFYINIKQIMKTIISRDTTGSAQTTITNLGFDNVTSIGCSVGLGRQPGSSFGGKVVLKIDGAKKGVCKMLEMESAVLKAPRFIPASVYSATFFNLDIKKAFSELGNILNSFSPQVAAMMYMPLLPPSPQGEPGVQLKGDIVDHLGSQIAITQSINKPFSNNPMPTETLIALATNNNKALEKSMSLLHSKMIAPNNPDAKRELLGHTIYLITMPAFPFFRPGMTPMQDPADAGVPQMPTMAFTITDTHLIFGAEPTVERAIRTLGGSETESVASAKWFNNAKSAIPSTVGLAGLQDNAASGDFFWWMLKKSGEAKTSNTPMAPNPALIFSQIGFDLFDFSLLPDFNAVRKYFGLSVSYAISRPDGFFSEFRNINPTGTTE